MKMCIALLLFVSITWGDAMIFNGQNTSETQIGVMAADANFSNELAKGSITEGQPISINGTTGSIAGQISYLSMASGTTTPPTPPSGGGGGGGIGNLFTCKDGTVLSQCSERNPGYRCTLYALVYDKTCTNETTYNENYTAIIGGTNFEFLDGVMNFITTKYDLIGVKFTAITLICLVSGFFSLKEINEKKWARGLAIGLATIIIGLVFQPFVWVA